MATIPSTTRTIAATLTISLFFLIFAQSRAVLFSESACVLEKKAAKVNAIPYLGLMSLPLNEAEQQHTAKCERRVTSGESGDCRSSGVACKCEFLAAHIRGVIPFLRKKGE